MGRPAADARHEGAMVAVENPLQPSANKLASDSAAPPQA